MPPLTTMRKIGADALTVQHTASGAKSAGAIVAIGRGFGRCFADIADGAIGTVHVRGIEIEVPKNTGVSYAAGDKVIWSATNSYVVSAGPNGHGWTVVEAAGSSATKVRVLLTEDPHVYGNKYTTDATDNTNNFATFTTGLGAIPAGITRVDIISSGNVHRKPQGAVAWTLGTCVVNDSGLAASEVIMFEASVL